MLGLAATPGFATRPRHGGAPPSRGIRSNSYIYARSSTTSRGALWLRFRRRPIEELHVNISTAAESGEVLAETAKDAVSAPSSSTAAVTSITQVKALATPPVNRIGVLKWPKSKPVRRARDSDQPGGQSGQGWSSFQFHCPVVVGDGNGKVGIGYGRPRGAGGIQKGMESARRAMVSIAMAGQTVVHTPNGEHGASKVRSSRLPPVTVSSAAARPPDPRTAGVKDALAKSLGSTDPSQLAKAA